MKLFRRAYDLVDSRARRSYSFHGGPARATGQIRVDPLLWGAGMPMWGGRARYAVVAPTGPSGGNEWRTNIFFFFHCRPGPIDLGGDSRGLVTGAAFYEKNWRTDGCSSTKFNGGAPDMLDRDSNDSCRRRSCSNWLIRAGGGERRATGVDCTPAKAAGTGRNKIWPSSCAQGTAASSAGCGCCERTNRRGGANRRVGLSSGDRGRHNVSGHITSAWVVGPTHIARRHVR